MKERREPLEKPWPDDYLWWAEVDRRFDELVECCPDATTTLLKLVKEDPQKFTQFWNTVEKLGRSRELRREIIPWLLRREPTVFTRHLLSKWWKDMRLGERFVAFTVHGALPRGEEVPEAWLPLYPERKKLLELNKPELIPILWRELSLSEKKGVLKKFPALVYLLHLEEECERLRSMWHLAKRRIEFLPLVLLELRRTGCQKDAEVIKKAVMKRYRRVMEGLEVVLDVKET